MRLHTASALFLFWVFCAPALVHCQQQRIACGRRKIKTEYLIQHGKDVQAGDWPWHAAIFYRMNGSLSYKCGGSIIDENTILTAAHCVLANRGIVAPAEISVHVGRSHLQEESDHIQEHAVKDIMVHSEFSRNSIAHDIALVRLASNITMTKFVQPVCVWTMEDGDKQLIIGKNGSIVGFGLTEDDVVSDQLKQAWIGVVDPMTCIENDRGVFATHLTSEMFCGGGQPGVSACNGDSGGGMFFEIGSKWFVRGIVSFTPKRENTDLCDGSKFTAFTDVAKYLGWMEQHVDPRVLSEVEIEEALEVDYEEKLRLFNFTTCGIKSQTITSNGWLWNLPWVGAVMVRKPSKNGLELECLVTLISEWYAVGPAHCFRDNENIRWIRFGGLINFNETRCNNNFDDTSENSTTICTYPTQILDIERVTLHPNYGSNNFVDNIALIELSSPADTTQPNVNPICLPVIPELRSNHTTNFTVASYSKVKITYVSHRMEYVESADCFKTYEEEGLTLTLENKRICARRAAVDAEPCNMLISGEPLQELRTIGQSERYFLRGFNLFNHRCILRRPSVYNNVNAYLDWMLYNMRYIEPDTEESEWNTFQQTPDNEMSRLDCSEFFKEFEIKNIIVHPSFSNPNHNIALIELLQPADLAHPYISPICLPFSDIQEGRKPLELTVMLTNFYETETRNLRKLLPATCQEQLVLKGYLNDHTNIPLCASDAGNSSKKISTFFSGAPLQTVIQIDRQKRHILSGLNVIEDVDNDLFPNLFFFTDTSLYLTWILNNIHYKDSNSTPNEMSLGEKPTDGLVNLLPVRNKATRMRPDINNCGIVSQRDIAPEAVAPWIGYVSSDAPIFATTECVVTLISEWYAVGPASCLNDDDKERKVNFGPVFLAFSNCSEGIASDCDPRIQSIPVQTIIVHPQYDRLNYSNDVGLVQFGKPADISEPYVKPICLPIMDEVRSYAKSDIAQLYYNDHTYTYIMSDKEKDVQKYVGSAECQKRWKGMAIVIDSDNICILRSITPDGNCFVQFPGLSLQTVQIVNQTERYFLRGFIEIMPKSCSLHYPVVYTDVDVYIDWILDTIDRQSRVSGTQFDLTERLVFL
ncbi:uncharacterized protein LOC128723915 [Anopheles nili]|uniref:uncharacterized protein LOC128723915 n=1 Tax=Anopheles nili TaxID=185578 RepID=UPI00237B7EC2|nr:uncharacterized protein LOC128723915 [Anopheles nili]